MDIVHVSPHIPCMLKSFQTASKPEPRQRKRSYVNAFTPYTRIQPTDRNLDKRGIRIADPHSFEARFLLRCQHDLIKHVGGKLTKPQRSLISHIANLELRILMLNHKFYNGHGTDHDDDNLVAHIGKVKLLYQILGIETPRPDFAELMDKHGLRKDCDNEDPPA
jgi:hypothetical protein